MQAKPCLSAERMVLATEAYQKYGGEPIYLHRAHVFEYVLDRKRIVIRDGELLAGNLSEYIRSAAIFPEYVSGRNWLKEQIPTMDTRQYDPFVITPEDKKTILDNLDWWDGKSTEDILDEYIPAKLREYKKSGFFRYNGDAICSSAICADFKRMFSLGFRAHIDICKMKIEEMLSDRIDVEKQRRIEYWQATIIALEAAIRYTKRNAQVAEEMAAEETNNARKRELLEMAEICRKVPEYPPESFREAIQFQWFMHVLHHIEAMSMATSLGRFDLNLYPYYIEDLRKGLITPEEALELIELLFLKVSGQQYLTDEYGSIADTGYPMWQTLMIGGIDAKGNKVCNDLTYMVLDATEDLKIVQPAVALRVTDDMPGELLDKAVRMIQKGMGNPAFFGNETAMKTVMNKGGTLEQARDWVIIGCMEPHPGGGGTCGNPTAGPINFPKCLELALHNGVDPITGKEMGLRTGDPARFTSINEVIEALRKQIDYIWDLHTRSVNLSLAVHGTYVPTIYQSVALDGCIERGLSIQEGGCNLPYTNIFIVGPSTIADSIAAIEYAVFRDKVLTMEELIHLCDTNFENNERMRQYLLNVPPKFGNDVSEVDEMISSLLKGCCHIIQQIPDGRGARGMFSAGSQSQSHNVASGLFVGATPDGRLAFSPLSDNASPHMGRDISGPTASANSVAHLPNEHIYGGCLYNLRFDPSGVEGEKGVETIKGVIKGFVNNGGYHIQINVVDNETLIKAQKDPENYRDLIVRVSGYLAYFTELEKTIQDAFIQRTAHLSK